MKLALGVLDQTPVKSGSSASEAIRESIELARHVDKLGYSRYWVAEHHGSTGLAGSVPEILINSIASVTKKIRVGSGGIMLNHYSPLKVAEVFSMLSLMYPERIDLGLGRAPGGGQLISAAMSYGSKIGVEYYPTKIADLIAFLNGTSHANKALEGISVSPKAEIPPQVWLLGSSSESAQIAAVLGLPFSYAHFIYPDGAKKIINLYRKNFKKSKILSSPTANICVAAICSEKTSEAEYYAQSRRLWRLQLAKGDLGPYPTPDEAISYNYSESELRIVKKNLGACFIGNPNKVKNDIQSLCKECMLDEALLLTIAHDKAARFKSYQLTSKGTA